MDEPAPPHPPPRRLMIVDIDGTIANCDHRKCLAPRGAHLRPVQWLAFSEACDADLIITDVCSIVLALAERYDPLFITSRPEACRVKTELWLSTRLGWHADAANLLMRPDDSTEPAYRLKPRLLLAAGYKPEQVALALDDDAIVIDTWRRMGIRAFNVRLF